MFSRFDIKGIYRRAISINLYTDFTKFDGEATIDEKKIYSSVVGGIGWAAIILRFDFVYLYGKLARYVTNPKSG